MKLRILAGPQSGRILDLPEGSFTIGRDAGCDLPLELPGVSRHHARITRHHGLFAIEDLGSTNGVRVNGQQIERSRTLINGDRIGISDAILLFTDDAHIADNEELTRIAERQAGGPRQRWLVPTLVAALAAVVAITAATLWLLSMPPDTPDTSQAMVTPGDEPSRQRPRPRRRLPKLPPPPAGDTPTELTGPQPVRYYHVLTEPSGATVRLGDRIVGTTPLFLHHLDKGSHTLHLSLRGYQDLTRHIYVPNDKPEPTFELMQLPKSCLVTSTPPGATIIHGEQILGITPAVLTDLPAGTYPLRLVRPDCQPVTVEAEFLSYRPTTAHAELPFVLGSASIVTFPAGADVLIDGFPITHSEPRAPGDRLSKEAVLDGFRPGPHRFQMRLHGVESDPQTATLLPNKVTNVVLSLWLPNTTVELEDGTVLNGMIRRELANQDVEFVHANRRIEVIGAARIKRLEVVPMDEFVRQRNQPKPEP